MHFIRVVCFANLFRVDSSYNDQQVGVFKKGGTNAFQIKYIANLKCCVNNTDFILIVFSEVEGEL